MAIWNIFSKRMKKLRKSNLEVYQYIDMPRELRVQVTHILNDALGTELEYRTYTSVSNIYRFIVKTLSREYGVFNLHDDNPDINESQRNCYRELYNFILGEKDIEKVLDAIEISLTMASQYTRNFEYLHKPHADERVDDAIDEVNKRFQENCVGYQFENDQMIRTDSTFLHAEVVKPALSLLNGKEFLGAEEEFMKAHEHFRHGRNKEAIAEALKAFESALKTICHKNKWKFEPGATAFQLLKICFDNGLVPAYLQSYYSSLRSTLESGIPAVRNKVGGHGQGVELIEVPKNLVAFSLYQTASAILFLVNSNKELNE